MCNTLGTYHVQHVVCHLVQRDGLAADLHRIKITFIFSFISKGDAINQLRWGGNQNMQRKCPKASNRKSHILKPENSSVD